MEGWNEPVGGVAGGQGAGETTGGFDRQIVSTSSISYLKFNVLTSKRVSRWIFSVAYNLSAHLFSYAVDLPNQVFF